MRTPFSVRLGMLLTAAVLISVTPALARAPAGPAREPDATSVFPPWQDGRNNDADPRGFEFTVPDIDDLADFHGARRKRAFEAAQNGPHAGDQFARAERLGDVIVGAEFESQDTVRFAAFGGKENHRDRGQTDGLTNGAANFQTVPARNHDVEDKKRRALAFGVGENIDSGGINAHHEAFVFQMMANKAGDVGIVFDDKDAGLHAIILAESVRST